MSANDFYEIPFNGGRYDWPRVTSILRVIDKPGIVWWAANMTEAALRLRLEDVLTTPGIEHTPQSVWDAMIAKVDGAKAHVRARDEAANIGTQAHALIRWHTLGMLGQEAGPEPAVPDAALRAVLAWLDWVRAVSFTPLYAELPLYCEYCGIAGTTDTIAKVNGLVTVVDYKSAPPPKDTRRLRVYPEALLQTGFYKHMAKMRGIETEQTMVVRLPKVEGDVWDATKDAVIGPPVPLRIIDAITTTWRTMRWIEGEHYGSAPVGRHP